MDQTTPTVGKLLTGTEGRDAIHFALAPVEAGEALRPGEHVCLVDGKAFDTYHCVDGCRNLIGVVDPFLTELVKSGQRFWLFLYPGTITSLRHVWTHPAFKTGIPTKEKP